MLSRFGTLRLDDVSIPSKDTTEMLLRSTSMGLSSLAAVKIVLFAFGIRRRELVFVPSLDMSTESVVSPFTKTISSSVDLPTELSSCGTYKPTNAPGRFTPDLPLTCGVSTSPEISLFVAAMRTLKCGTSLRVILRILLWVIRTTFGAFMF